MSHAVIMATHATPPGRWVMRPHPPAPPGFEILWAAVCDAQEPAESLPSAHRAALFRSLRADGWTPAAIGAWTRTTEYTVRRILGHTG